VSSSDFRHIATRTEAGKAERLFRAAISAFCCLPRPSRREIAQLEDLALPLFDSVSPEGLRFAAATLSECAYAPPELVRRLCEASVDIAAPLLIRSQVLTDIDLIALVGRHGLPHARAIARRKDLNPTIAVLIRALEKPAPAQASAAAINPEATTIAPKEPERIPGQAAEATRRKLRSIMLADRVAEAGSLNPSARSGIYARLRETALTGNAAFFQTALADALGIDFLTARALMASSDHSALLTALRALDIGEDKAFLIAVAVFPTHFPHPQAIRQFLDRYRLLHREAATERVREWKAEAASRTIIEARRATANSDMPAEAASALKAS
jgi:uncharacterized protein (DUF2336 family)